MIKSTMFRRHFFLTMGILIAFLIWGFFVTQWLMRINRPDMGPPWGNFARIIDGVGQGDRVKGIQTLSNWDSSFTKRLVLLDADGNVLFPEGATPGFNWSKIKIPQSPYEHTPVRTPEEGPPGFLVRLPNEPVQYLYSEPPPRPRGAGPLINLLILGASVLLGVGLALFLIYRSWNAKALMADHVISELQRGNLKARFPVTRMDEIGQAMTRFNLMAEEVERLVEQLRQAERSRRTLLQELAHDLRTPVASLKNLLETLSSKRSKMEPSLQEEFMNLSLEETSYLERLVEDLLFLAQVGEPRYQAGKDPVDVLELLHEEANRVSVQGGGDGRKVNLVKDLSTEPFQVPGDRHLLRRLLRNAFDNSFSFAKNEVRVSAQLADDGRLEVVWEDDGPGFSDEALKSFGERRISRGLEKKQGGRLSLGLGSVIMKAVSEAHRGQIVVSNRTDSQGRVLGATLRLSLPL